MTLPFVLVASIVLPLILIPTAKRLGGRSAGGVAARRIGLTQPTPATPYVPAEVEPGIKEHSRRDKAFPMLYNAVILSTALFESIPGVNHEAAISCQPYFSVREFSW